MRHLARRLSPSMVVACIALLVALAGVGVAATQLPANSVGTLQLRANSVTSLKVRDGSLRRVDFMAGQLPAGAAGPAGAPGRAGPAGPAGTQGPKGDKGDPGPIGPSDAIYDTNAGPIPLPAVTEVRVGTVSLPAAGKYVLWGKVTFHADASHTQLTASVCVLATGPTNQFDAGWTFVAPGALGTIGLTAATSVDSATAINLYCNVSGTSTVQDIHLVAIKVGTLTTSTG